MNYQFIETHCRVTVFCVMNAFAILLCIQSKKNSASVYR